MYGNDIEPFSLVLLGNSSSGKKAIMRRFLTGHYIGYTINSKGVEFFTKEIKLKDGSKIKLKIIDLPYQEKSLEVTTSFIQNSDGALLVFSHGDRKSFDNLINWLDLIYANCPKWDFNIQYPIYLVGNNCDLASVISKEEIEEFKRKYNFGGCYIDTSPKENINIDELFLKMGEILFQIYGKRENLKLAKKGKKKDCVLI